MPYDTPLTPHGRAALLLLVAAMADGTSNPELKDRFGVTITGDEWRGLDSLKLIRTEKAGRSLTHTVLDAGWARAGTELGGELPGTMLARAAIQAVNGQFQRYLVRTDLRLADIFAAEEPAEPPAEDLAADEAEPLESRIRAAYRSLAPRPNAPILLSSLRPLLVDVPRDALDDALRDLARSGRATLEPESNRKALTAADRDAAVEIGRQCKHLLTVDDA